MVVLIHKRGSVDLVVHWHIPQMHFTHLLLKTTLCLFLQKISKVTYGCLWCIYFTFLYKCISFLSAVDLGFRFYPVF